ncbi:hypothetical protein HK102_012142, partial [Quaeritorhiza haematococci]
MEAPDWLIEVLTPGSVPYNHVRGSYIRQTMAEKDSGSDSESDVELEPVLTENKKFLLNLDLTDRMKEVAKHVKKLRADRAVDRQSWIEVGMAIHHATDGQGMELWDEFSRRAGPYDRHTLEYQWNSFRNGSGITMGSLIHWAKEDARTTREENKRAKAEQEKMKCDETLRREVVKFGVDHTGGQGIFEGWNAEKSVAVIRNTMHHPDHHVECVFNSEGAYQRCLECAWRNPFAGELVVSQTKYPALHQQFFNITINHTIKNYNNNNNNDNHTSNSTELELWDDEAHLADDYQPFDDPELSLNFKRAFSGIDSDFGRFIYHLNLGTVVASGEDKTLWYKLKGFRWEQVEVAQIK